MTSSAEPLGTFDDRQRAFAKDHPDLEVLTPERGTLVILPSLTVPVDELRKLVGMHHYEERLLFYLLALRHPELRVVYLSSLPIEPAIIDYYLGLLPDLSGARERLALITIADSRPLPLTEKLLQHPEVIKRLQALTLEPRDSWLLPFVVTDREQRLAELLGLPLYGPRPELAALGSKSGSRHVAAEAGVPIPDGAEDLWSLDEVEHALDCLRARIAPRTSVVVKLNDSFSGLGNAIVDVGLTRAPIRTLPTTFAAAGESWPTYAAKIAARGAVVEELIATPGTRSPSVLVQITPGGSARIAGTHEQLLGGPGEQVYLGCRSPAAREYRNPIQGCAEQVAKALAARGVVGLFGIDFLVEPARNGGCRVLLGEINLRLGGTTHPLGVALLATGATYDRATGTLMVSDRRPKAYIATDNIASRRLVGRVPAEVITCINRHGLGFRPSEGTGVVLHMLGALPLFGKLGFTCIGDTPEEATALYERTLDTLDVRPKGTNPT
jgi:hypothetical protein